MSVLSKATLALDCLGQADAPMRLGALAAALGLPKSSAHRLLAELASLGIVRKLEGGYLLGPRLMYWGTIAAEEFDLRTLAEPAMRRLRDQVGDSVHLYVNDNNSRVCIASVEARHSLRAFAALGRPGLPGLGSSGRMLLAFSNDTRRRTVIAELERVGAPHVPTIAELDRIREERFDISYGEREDGVNAAATSIHGADGRAVAAMTVSGPGIRLTRDRLESLRPALFRCAAEIAERIAEDSALAAST